MNKVKQTQIGMKNHNITTYLEISLKDFISGKQTPNEEYEKTNYLSKKKRAAKMTDNQTRTEICPECKSDKITFLLWGLPAFSDKLEKEIDEGKVELCGCCVDPHSKQFRCNNCNFEWGKV